ncbi:DNA cytosine methyltransferase [Litoreibacter roseus]|nr:DNA cytosine methyltransferase [Litoreibacter roseus]
MLTALDLFSGAGGFSLGIGWAGIEVVAAIEHDRFAAETYRKNHRNTQFFQRDVAGLSDKEIKSHFDGVEVLFGGPPCQGFSVAGPSQYNKSDERNRLIFEFERYARVLSPRFIVVENVKGVVNGRLGKRRGALTMLSDALSVLGYRCEITVVRASNFLVPQTRERVFLFAHREDSSLGFERLLEKRRTPDVVASWEALSDLPPLGAGEGIDGAQKYFKKAGNQFQNWARKNSSEVRNHMAMKHTKRIIERLQVIDPGQSLKDVSTKYGQRKRNSQDVDVTKRYKMNCFRIDPAGPSITLPANFQTIHVHPFQDRMLTAREGARLQSFPDDYVFYGPRTLMSRKLLEREGRQDEIGLSQYNQIGNAVAPRVAFAIGAALVEASNQEEDMDVAEFA